jgi:acetyl-CoA acyltransferase
MSRTRASGSTALLQAYAHIRAGLCDIALVVAAEKMFFPDRKAAMLQAFMGGTDIHTIEDTRGGMDGSPSAPLSRILR